MSLKSRILGLGLALVLLVSPARAGEADRFLPADTEVYSVVNLRQILSSALVKQIGGEDLKNLRAMLAQQQEVMDVLKDLGLDPFKDIDRIVSAGPSSGEQDKGLIIVHGRFDVEKFRERADKEAKAQKDVIKKIAIAGQDAYEVVVADAGLSLFIGFAGNKTILAAMSKDYLGDALRVKPEARAALKNKAFQEMIEKLDEKQSIAMVLNGDVLTKGPLGDLPIKDTLAKVTTISGGLTLTDGIKIEVVGGTKTAADAKQINEMIANGINALIGLAALAGMQNPQIAPAADLLKSIRTSSRDKTVTLKAEFSAEDLKKLQQPKDQ